MSTAVLIWVSLVGAVIWAVMATVAWINTSDKAEGLKREVRELKAAAQYWQDKHEQEAREKSEWMAKGQAHANRIIQRLEHTVKVMKGEVR